MGGRLLEGPTMGGRTSDWNEELGCLLKPFLDRLGHKARRQICPLYVSGLIGPGDRKSIAPIAKRLALGECDQLHHFITAGVWDAKPVETELLVQADRLVGGSDAAKCRSCWRCGYFFPRVGRASGLGWSERVFRPNIERHGQSRMALADIDRVVAAGARLGCVLADAGYA